MASDMGILNLMLNYALSLWQFQFMYIDILADLTDILCSTRQSHCSLQQELVPFGHSHSNLTNLPTKMNQGDRS